MLFGSISHYTIHYILCISHYLLVIRGTGWGWAFRCGGRHTLPLKYRGPKIVKVAFLGQRTVAAHLRLGAYTVDKRMINIPSMLQNLPRSLLQTKNPAHKNFSKPSYTLRSSNIALYTTSCIVYSGDVIEYATGIHKKCR